jgi:hypothetical protein
MGDSISVVDQLHAIGGLLQQMDVFPQRAV